ncbi:hypothetical protein MMC17_001819 [Xylographa soralifera]|nr:hypothetical protein [Xylographa soralifera]
MNRQQTSKLTQLPVLAFLHYAGQTIAVKNDSNLCSKIQALAQEIQDMILDFVIKVSLNPGRVYFGNRIGINVLPGLLKIPNHALHWKVVTTLFADNTWVLPRGGKPEAELLLQLPQPSLFSIRSMELTFSWNDAWSFSPGDCLMFINNKGTEPNMDNEPVDKDILAQDYHTERIAWTNEVLRIWNDKYDLLRGLPLEHLKLDFSAANGMDDLLPDSPLVSLLLRTFTYGVPPHLEIVAPTTELEQIIRDIIRRKNRHLMHNRVCTMCVTGMHAPEFVNPKHGGAELRRRKKVPHNRVC